MAAPRIPVTDRFWAKVMLSDASQCWPWSGAKNGYGYGILDIGGRQVRAHRVSWELHYGSPGKLCVLHRCDNPPCVNPNHLFLGTRAQNADDKVQKGRARGGSLPGSSNPDARLTEAEVTEIRRLVAADKTRGAQARAARRFGVTPTMISYIVKRKKWGHVA